MNDYYADKKLLHMSTGKKIKGEMNITRKHKFHNIIWIAMFGKIPEKKKIIMDNLFYSDIGYLVTKG